MLELRKSYYNIKPTITASNPNDGSSNNERKIIVLPYIHPISEFIAANIEQRQL